MNVKDKKIILFGGTSGIGLSTAIMLSEMGAKKIYAISRNPEKCNFNANNLSRDENGSSQIKTFGSKNKADIKDLAIQILWVWPPLNLEKSIYGLEFLFLIKSIFKI